jgi:hypothetical protein
VEELWSDDDDKCLGAVYDDDDARADDTANASTVATTLGAACAPDGFEIIEQCPLPDVTDKTELNKLVGQKILYAFDDDHYGWYIGTIFSTNPKVSSSSATRFSHSHANLRLACTVSEAHMEYHFR